MTRFDRPFFLNLDWTLLVLVVGICTIGILNIYSAGYSLISVKTAPFYVKQIQWVCIGLFLMVAAFLIDYRLICQFAYVFYGIGIFLLILVAVYGYTTHGSQRWIVLGGFSFQPSELIKIALILALARYFSDHRSSGGYGFKDLLIPLALVLAPFLLIVRQPDLGTGLMMLLVFGSMVLFVGIRWRDLLWTLALAVILAPVGWFFLHDYQKDRILTFFNPDRDPLGTGYHIIQSMIAVGSGGASVKATSKALRPSCGFSPNSSRTLSFPFLPRNGGFSAGRFSFSFF
jgi:rod shape determining protein RodA